MLVNYSNQQIIEGLSGNSFFISAQNSFFISAQIRYLPNRANTEEKPVGICRLRAYSALTFDYIPGLSLVTGFGKTIIGIAYTVYHLYQTITQNQDRDHHLTQVTMGICLLFRGVIQNDQEIDKRNAASQEESLTALIDIQRQHSLLIDHHAQDFYFRDKFWLIEEV